MFCARRILSGETRFGFSSIDEKNTLPSKAKQNGTTTGRPSESAVARWPTRWAAMKRASGREIIGLRTFGARHQHLLFHHAAGLSICSLELLKPPEGALGLSLAPEPRQRRAALVVGSRVPGVEPYHGIDFPQALFELPPRDERAPKLVAPRDVARSEREGFAEPVLRLRAVPLAERHHSEVVEGLGVLRLELERAAERLARRVRLRQGPVRDSEVKPGRRRSRQKLDCPAVLVERFRDAAVLVQGAAEPDHRFALAGPQLHAAPVSLHGILVEPGAKQRVGQGLLDRPVGGTRAARRNQVTEGAAFVAGREIREARSLLQERRCVRRDLAEQ